MTPLRRIAARAATLPVVLGGAALYLLARCFLSPGVPVLFGGDQGFFWMYGERIRHGEVPYVDFFQFTTPGTDLVFAGAFTLLGPRVWVANIVIVALGVALAGTCFSVARRLAGDADALLASAAFTVLVFGQALNATHHWWSLLAIVSAVGVLGAGPTARRSTLAGGLLGVAAFFTQSHAATTLLAFAVFLVWHEARTARARARPPRVGARLVGLVASAATSFLVLMAYFLVVAGPVPLWTCLGAYVSRYMTYTAWGLALPDALTWTSLRWLAPYLLVYAVVPVAYVVTARRAMNVEGAPLLSLSWLVGVALLVEISAGFSWARLFAVAMPAVILLVGAIPREGRDASTSRGGGWLVVAVLACVFLRSTHRQHSAVLDLPGGRVATTPSNAAELRELDLAVRAQPGSPLFAANRVSVYWPLGLKDPLFLDAAIPGKQTPREHAERAIAELEASRVGWVLWTPAPVDLTAQGAGDGWETLRSHLESHYRLARTFEGGDELWERR
jgi:hypothetical protein